MQNVTDIDDKIIERANRRGISTHELAEEFTKRYFEDMESLNIRLADENPRATEEIPRMIEVIQGLVAKGYDVGGADGLVGFKTRTAIGAWQERQGRRSSCFPDNGLLKAIR